jgi:PHS family inorganic phosphate transporter-like MFS transporter
MAHSIMSLTKFNEPDVKLSGYECFMEHMKTGFQDPDIYKNITATALGWLIYDIGFYGSNAFIPMITELVFHSGGDDDQKIKISEVATQGMMLTAIGLPAVLSALWSLQKLGTKTLAVWGFLLIALSTAILAAIWRPVNSSWTLFGGYLLLSFALNWGPNMTTFVLPQEVFPVEIRATFNGFAAACGKLGAVIGIWIFEKISVEYGVVTLMVIVTIVNIIGAIICQVCISDELWLNQHKRVRRTLIDRTISYSVR